MNLLLTNDDGIAGDGILALAKELSKKHKVMVVAPKFNMSATGHSLTIGKRQKLEEIQGFAGGVKAYAFYGTPADCVKFAHDSFRDFSIDCVVSGINRGSNLGSDTMYSGTVAAALEGAYLGYPAIAFSSCSDKNNFFDVQAQFADKILEQIFPLSKKDFIWNVNFPNIEKSKILGVAMTELGVQKYSDRYTLEGTDEYVLSGEPFSHFINPKDCDVELIKEGYITITPMHCNRTDRISLIQLKAEKIIL